MKGFLQEMQAERVCYPVFGKEEGSQWINA